MGDVELKQARLVERLYEMTVARKLSWTTETYNVLHAELGKHIVTLKEETWPDGTPVEEVAIYTEGWTLVDTFTDEDLKQQRPQYSGDIRMFYDLLKKLRNMAERQARNVDKAIDEIMLELDDLENSKNSKDDDLPF